MRLGDADREELYERLSRHAAAGRLSVPELERRVGIVAAATTREEAAAALVDLPPLPAAPSPGSGARPRRGRGHGDAAAPAADWRPTAERFRDPRTGNVMRVWEDPAGGRHYVVDDDQA
ncbi:MAG TPA: DUF1707 domain-containing protein [Solirubrobacteraceae bacterium]|nr:DUF1707 domain-containing protein [Solirubrobacteraceae bacterium]